MLSVAPDFIYPATLEAVTGECLESKLEDALASTFKPCPDRYCGHTRSIW
jgi:hypothetical protein